MEIGLKSQVKDSQLCPHNANRQTRKPLELEELETFENKMSKPRKNLPQAEIYPMTRRRAPKRVSHRIT